MDVIANADSQCQDTDDETRSEEESCSLTFLNLHSSSSSLSSFLKESSYDSPPINIIMFRKNEKEAPHPKNEKMTVKVVEDLLHLYKTNDLVGAIDQGTSSTRFLVFTPKADIAAWAQMEHTQIFPPGEDKVSELLYIIKIIMKERRDRTFLNLVLKNKQHDFFVLLLSLLGWLARTRSFGNLEQCCHVHGGRGPSLDAREIEIYHKRHWNYQST
jgi:hypothetical protein